MPNLDYYGNPAPTDGTPYMSDLVDHLPAGQSYSFGQGPNMNNPNFQKLGLQMSDITAAQSAPGFNLADAAQAATVPITLNSLTTQPTVTLPQSNLSPTGADSAVAGAKSYVDYAAAATPPPTPESTQADTLSKQLMDLVGQDTGKAQALSTAEANLGVPDMSKQLADINGQVLTGKAEYDQLRAAYDKVSVDNRGKPITMNSIIGNEAQINYAKNSELNNKAADINLNIARGQALQGNITQAQATAQKAVDLQYAAIEDQIAVKQAQLKILEPILTKQQVIQATALQRQYEDQKQALADQKAQAKTNITTALESGVTSHYANKNGEIFDVNSGVAYSTPADFFKAAGVSSFEEAYAKGFVQDTKNTNLDFVTETVNGRKVRIGFDKTGKKVSQVDLGSSSTGLGNAPKTVSGAASTIKQAWQDQGYIQGNGKISSQDYKDAKTYWTTAPPNGLGYTVAQFDNQFSSMIDKTGSNWRKDYSYTGQ